MRPLTTSVRRKPNQRSAVEAVNFIRSAPAAVAKVSEPDSNGDEAEADLQQERQQEGHGADADAENEARRRRPRRRSGS